MQAIVGASSPFIREIEQTLWWQRRKQHPGFYPFNADSLIDSWDKLAELANLAFWASLAVEEGRPPRGRLCLVKPRECDLVFESVEPLDVECLTKLLTAAASPVGIQLDASSRLVAWGLVNGAHMDAVELGIHGNGTIALTIGDEVVSVLRGGRVWPVRERGPYSVMNILSAAVANELDFPERLRRAALILRIAAGIRKHGHGGALLIGPPSSRDWLADISIRFRFAADCAQDLNGVLKSAAAYAEAGPVEVVGGQPRMRPNPDSHRGVETARIVGQLSAIDGVVVIDEDLNLIGFGAKLQPSDGGDFTVDRLDREGKHHVAEPHTVAGGMRHQSAARFVRAHHDCIALVASQDGRMTLMGWVADTKTVMIIEGLEDRLWTYRA